MSGSSAVDVDDLAELLVAEVVVTDGWGVCADLTLVDEFDREKRPSSEPCSPLEEEIFASSCT
jgi:hypothetical protein